MRCVYLRSKISYLKPRLLRNAIAEVTCVSAPWLSGIIRRRKSEKCDSSDGDSSDEGSLRPSGRFAIWRRGRCVRGVFVLLNAAVCRLWVAVRLLLPYSPLASADNRSSSDFSNISRQAERSRLLSPRLHFRFIDIETSR